MKVRVSCVQMNCNPGNTSENMSRAGSLIQKAASEGAQIVCLPELFSTGYDLGEKFRELCEEIPGQTTDTLAAKARKYGVHLVAGIPEREKKSGRIYDSAVVVSPSGHILATYRKVHLVGEMEKSVFTAGEEILHFEIGETRFGLMICADQCFPEFSRVLKTAKVDIVVHPTAWFTRQVWEEAWGRTVGVRTYRTHLAARALENGFFVASANRTGVEGDMVFVGHSCIVSPWGRIVSELGSEEGFAVADLDLEKLHEWRAVYGHDFYADHG